MTWHFWLGLWLKRFTQIEYSGKVDNATIASGVAHFWSSPTQSEYPGQEVTANLMNNEAYRVRLGVFLTDFDTE